MTVLSVGQVKNIEREEKGQNLSIGQIVTLMKKGIVGVCMDREEKTFEVYKHYILDEHPVKPDRFNFDPYGGWHCLMQEVLITAYSEAEAWEIFKPKYPGKYVMLSPDKIFSFKEFKSEIKEVK